MRAIITDAHMQKFEALKEGERFDYATFVGVFPAVKFCGGAILENSAGRFIVAKAYNNCLDIGSGYVVEYLSEEDALKDAPKLIKWL